MAENGHFGHFLGHSEVSENGHNEFPMPQNLGIHTKIRLVGCSEPKLQVWPFEWPKMAEMAILPNDFGHLGHSEVSENGPNGFPMPNNLGIDTKITFLECSEPKLWVWPLYGHLSGHKWPKMAISASLANLRWLKMVSMNFPCPKTLG